MTDGPTPAPLPLILCLPAPEAVPAAAALLPAGQPVADLAAAEAGLAAMPGARLVLICPAPAVWVAQSLAAGAAPAGAVAAWRQGLRPVMALLRTRRRQVRLVFAGALEVDPAPVAEVLGLSLAGDRAAGGVAPADPVLVMIARDTLARDVAAQALADELAASALLTGAGDAPDPEQALMAYDARRAAQRQAETEAATARTALTAAEARHESEARLLHNQIRLADEAAATAQAALTKAQARLSDAEGIRDSLQAEVGLLREQIRADSEMMAGLETALSEAKGAHDNLQAEAGLLREQIRADAEVVAGLETALSELKNIRSAQQAEIKLLREQIRSRSETATGLETALSEAKADRGALQAEIGLLREQIHADSETAGGLEAALSEAKADRGALQAEIRLLREQIRADIDVQSRLEAVLRASRLETREARGQAEAEFSQMIGQLREQVFQTGQALAGHHSQLEALQAERADLMSQIEQVEGAREELEGYYDRARQFSGRIEALTGDIGRLQAEAEAARQALDDRTRQAEFLEAEIGRIHRSRSYRLTEPLRKIRSKTRK